MPDVGTIVKPGKLEEPAEEKRPSVGYPKISSSKKHNRIKDGSLHKSFPWCVIRCHRCREPLRY